MQSTHFDIVSGHKPTKHSTFKGCVTKCTASRASTFSAWLVKLYILGNTYYFVANLCSTTRPQKCKTVLTVKLLSPSQTQSCADIVYVDTLGVSKGRGRSFQKFEFKLFTQKPKGGISKCHWKLFPKNTIKGLPQCHFLVDARLDQ